MSRRAAKEGEFDNNNRASGLAPFPRAARFPGRSLRARVALGVALPVLLALVALSLLSYWRERNLLENELHMVASLLGEVVASGLRQAMMTHDGAMLTGVLQNIAEMEAISRVRIVD